MRIIQVLGNLSYGDAIGNHTVALKQLLQRAHYRTEIFAEGIDKRFSEGTAKPLYRLHGLRKNDIVIYHMSFGSPLNLQFKTWKCRKILMYHNITPPKFFEPYSASFATLLQQGLEQTAQLVNSVERCIVMSEFNKRDLIAMGYSADQIWVMPGYLIPFEDYASPPNAEMWKQYSDGWVNILFIGRFAPNKRQEDVIRAFAYYKKHINAKSRLILVGSSTLDDYMNALQRYVEILNVPNVIFPGHISFQQLIALYHSASVFLCMSEHEGFCVPLVEAMYFDVPIIAYGAAAIPETLKGCGVLLDSKEPTLAALCIKRIMEDFPLRERICAGQRARLKQLMPKSSGDAFLRYLKKII